MKRLLLKKLTTPSWDLNGGTAWYRTIHKSDVIDARLSQLPRDGSIDGLKGLFGASKGGFLENSEVKPVKWRKNGRQHTIDHGDSSLDTV
jgi:hypothetical protein